MTEKAGDSAIQIVECEVAIVGGGMVGLTLGVALTGAGVETVVIDAMPAAGRIAPGYDGRSSAIALGSQRALEGIGLWVRLADVAQPILDIRVSDGSTGDDARHPTRPRGGGASHLFLHYDHRAAAGGKDAEGDAAPFGYIVENRAIRTALIDVAAALPNLLHLAPASLASESLRPGHVELALEDGRQIRARLLIGADGRNSRVREGRGIGAARWDYAQTGIVCTVTHALPHDGVAHEHFLPAGPFAVLPMTDDEHGHRSSIVWTERKDLAPAMLALSDDEFSAEMMRRFGTSLGDMNLLGGRWSHPLGVLHADRYTDKRMALIGDAAHGIHPIAGQGLNLGLRDVAALAETIVDARRIGLDIGVGEPLERYARWRRVDNLLLIAATDSLNRLFANDIAAVRLARDLGLAAVDRMPAVKRFFMRQAMGLVGDLPRLVRGEAL
ncbi:MAG: UbiH/UbiF/VisC/COQ6 family ubiquinone biosynthesis hydroxylase [Dongiaceae bacterium]